MPTVNFIGKGFWVFFLYFFFKPLPTKHTASDFSIPRKPSCRKLRFTFWHARPLDIKS